MRALLAIITLDLVLIAVWVFHRLRFMPGEFSPSEVSPFFVAAGVLLAWFTLLKNREKDASKDFLESARDLITKAYDALKLDSDGRPQNDRMNWLTAARLIRSAETTASSITEHSHKKIWEETLNYFRGKFYDLIEPSGEGFPSEYFAEKPEHMYIYGSGDRASLAESSLTVLYRFVRWPDGVPDLLNEEKKFSDEEIKKMTTFGPRGLGRLLSQARQIVEKKTR